MTASMFIDPLARSSYYAQRGFDSRLTHFPIRAFDQSIYVAGLADKADEQDASNAESPIERNVLAYRHLFQLERGIRKFINEAMTAEFGANWVERQLPEGMRNDWISKREKARLKGEAEQPLINYADFTDYIRIIERKDNWKTVFKSVFQREENIRELFTRIFPIRICTMHGRIVTLDDELYLRVEARRVLRAIKEV